MTLKAKILKRAAFGFEKLKAPYDMGGDNTDESAVFALGAQQENARLVPLLECLAETADDARQVLVSMQSSCDSDHGNALMALQDTIIALERLLSSETKERDE